MRNYEIVYIFRSSFTPEEIDAKLERYHAPIAGADGGQITAVEQWGKRQLAYPIDKEPNGFYVVAQFTSDPSGLSELERILKLEDDLLRYLIVLSEGELPIPPSMREERDAAARRVAAAEARREESQAAGKSEATEEPEAEARDEAAEVPDAEPASPVAEEPAVEAGADAGETKAEVREPAAEKGD
jgi:small subunit ribosomal protein S6